MENAGLPSSLPWPRVLVSAKTSPPAEEPGKNQVYSFSHLFRVPGFSLLFLVCTRMLLACYSYVFVCYSHLLVCYSYLLVCYSYVLICYSYLLVSTRMLLVVPVCSFSHDLCHPGPHLISTQGLLKVLTVTNSRALQINHECPFLSKNKTRKYDVHTTRYPG